MFNIYLAITNIENIPGYLEFKDVVDEIKNPNYVHFCHGAINPEDNKIQYYDFKRRLIAYIKGFGSSAG